MNILKNLKKKFILINLLSVMSIISIVSGIFLYTNIKNYKDNTFAFMDMELYRYAYGFVYAKDEHRPENTINSEFKFEKKRSIKSIFLTLDKSKNIIHNLSFNNSITVSDINSYIDTVINSPKDYGNIHSTAYKYKKYTFDNYIYIIFSDISLERAYIRQIIILFTVIYLSSFIIFLLLSNFLASFSLSPVKKSWEEQTRFVSDASHELRTPVSIVIANLNILEKRLVSISDSDKKWLQNSKLEMNNMTKLIENLLFLARSDKQNKLIELTKVNLSSLINERSLNIEVLAFEKNIAFTTNITPELYIYADSDLLNQLFTILTDNALKYSPEHGHIFIKVFEKNGKNLLSIKNLGSYIPKENITHIFERFYRADKSRNSSIKGYGLGLSIANEICKKLDAKINVYSNENKGTEFVVTFKAFSQN